MADTLAQFHHKLDRLEKDVSDRHTLTVMGMGAKDDVADAVRGEIGDLSMSNWRRLKPIQIVARFDIQGDVVEVVPSGGSRGPLTVLERGRRPGVSRRRGSKGRAYGGSAGKGTWSDAVRLMADRTPRRVHAELVKALRRLF